MEREIPNEDLVGALAEAAVISAACLRMKAADMKKLIAISIDIQNLGGQALDSSAFEAEFNLCLEQINATTVALAAACERLGVEGAPKEEVEGAS